MLSAVVRAKRKGKPMKITKATAILITIAIVGSGLLWCGLQVLAALHSVGL